MEKDQSLVATQHKAVLIDEVIAALQPSENKIFLDVTCGGGTHTQALLNADPMVKVIALDWDPKAIKRLEPLVEHYQGRLTLIWASFAHLYKISKKHHFPQFDGILADFGTSQDQIYTNDGFSFTIDTPLDMRMSSSHFKTTAFDIVNYATSEELRHILWTYGEEQRAKDIVAMIIESRKKQKIKTTHELARCVIQAIGWNPAKKTHPATRTFQALRIFVNKELDNISAFLPSAFDLLKTNGRLACISFHSLEDRLVKDFYKTIEKKGKGNNVSSRAITPQDQEIANNQSSRSSKLRILEKK